MNESLNNVNELRLKEEGFDLGTVARLDFAKFREASTKALIAEGKSYELEPTKANRMGFVYLGESRPTSTALVPQMVGDPLGPILYGYLSGYTHAAPFAVLEGVRESPNPDDPEGAFMDFALSPRNLELAVCGALLGVIATVERQMQLYGRGASFWEAWNRAQILRSSSTGIGFERLR